MTWDFNRTFAQLGKIGKTVSDANAYAGTTLATDISNLAGEFSGDDLTNIDGVWQQLTSAQSSTESILTFLQQCAQNIIVWEAQQTGSPNQLVLQDALAELIAAMVANSQSVKTNTCAAGTVTAASGNIGDGIGLASVLNPLTSVAQEYLFPETVTLTCTSDVSTGSTLGNELFSVAGQAAESDTLAWDYPLGSGGLTSLNACSDAGGSVLTDGSFESWSTNTPTNWTILTGTAGTQILKSTSPVYVGSACLQIVGDSSTHTALDQSISPTYDTLYGVNLWIRVDVVPAAGVLQIEVTDGSSVVADNAGNDLVFTKTLSGLSANTWTPINAVFSIPHIAPGTGYFFRIGLSTALSSGSNLFIDQASMGSMTQLYQAGPWFSLHSGSVNYVAGPVADSYTCAVSNDFGGASGGKTFQLLADRLFGLKALGMQLPSSGSPTQADALIS